MDDKKELQLGIRISEEDKRKLIEYCKSQRRSVADQIMYWLDRALIEANKNKVGYQ